MKRIARKSAEAGRESSRGQLGTLASEIFTAIDRHFAALMGRLAGSQQPVIDFTAALASRQRRAGHVCLHLPSVAGQRLSDVAGESAVVCPPLASWLGALRAVPVVGRPGEFKPLILDAGNRLYLQRYWAYEDALARDICKRAAIVEACDETRLRAALDKYFPAGDEGPGRQRIAAETAARRSFCVITGGPGTGKTHTLVSMLAVLDDLHEGPPLRFALTAPTGKAAARIQEEVRRAAGQFGGEFVAAGFQQAEATTLHRLLGARVDSAKFRRSAKNPIPADVVVVDEASMVDLALMARLFDAVPPGARIILLGDKDQLSSVEAGAVLGDICAVPTTGTDSPLAACIVELRRNYRFGSQSPIHQLSTAINVGDADAALASLGETGSGGTVIGSALPSSPELKSALRVRLLPAWEGGLTGGPAAVLERLARFRVLCAVREGPYGVRHLNELAEEILEEQGIIQRNGRHYAGRPILITRNHHALRLFNGDVGVILPDPADGGLRAFFPATDGGVRSVLPARLPEHETVHAMTVHKSQGSEFASVLLVLPDRSSPVLTRELLYTGLTRARERAELWFTEGVFRQAVARRVERHSGLRDALWPTSNAQSEFRLA